MLTWISGSSLSTDMADFCGNKAQHIGVANVKQMPHKRTCKGAPTIGYRASTPLRSRRSIRIGGNTVRKGVNVRNTVKQRNVPFNDTPTLKANT